MPLQVDDEPLAAVGEHAPPNRPPLLLVQPVGHRLSHDAVLPRPRPRTGPSRTARRNSRVPRRSRRHSDDTGSPTAGTNHDGLLVFGLAWLSLIRSRSRGSVARRCTARFGNRARRHRGGSARVPRPEPADRARGRGWSSSERAEPRSHRGRTGRSRPREQRERIAHWPAAGVVELPQPVAELLRDRGRRFTDRIDRRCVECEPLGSGRTGDPLTEREQTRGWDPVAFEVEQHATECDSWRTPQPPAEPRR